MENCRIVTKIGEVIGRIEGDFRIFRGIPYAVCERFGYPKEVPYRGVFDATKTEKDCYQYSAFRDESEGPDSFYHKEFRSDRTFSYTEHEMCLNIITRKKAENDPVLVFIHGGGFETGTIGELPYGDTTEYAKRGIVFVSLGYRLNVFSLYEGNNFGFYDLEAGIRFVHDHIRDFGGDPSRIVLIGQSAGAMAIMDSSIRDVSRDSSMARSRCRAEAWSRRW